MLPPTIAAEPPEPKPVIEPAAGLMDGSGQSAIESEEEAANTRNRRVDGGGGGVMHPLQSKRRSRMLKRLMKVMIARCPAFLRCRHRSLLHRYRR